VRNPKTNTLDIGDVRQRFDAHAAGAVSAGELKQAVLDAVSAEPQLAAAYVALTTAYFRNPASDQALREAILRDIERVSGAYQDSSRAKSEMAPLAIESPTLIPRRDDASVDAAPAAAQNDSQGAAEPVQQSPGATESDWSAVRASIASSLAPISYLRPGKTGGGTGSAWDSPEEPDEPAQRLKVGSVLRNRYELQAELGRGGMGVVYKALDRASAEFKDRSPYVAIKVLSEEFKRHPLAVQSLARESKKTSKLAHPHVVTVYNFSRGAGNVFMVMELLEGLSLDQLLKREGPTGLPRPRVLGIVRALGEALGYAHQQGLVHADLKPSNVFITKDNIVKVLDFGIARAAQQPVPGAEKTAFDISQLNAISPTYASLEMLRGQPPDVRDDVYALACIVYELYTGRHPYNRIEATKARDANLQPAPIRGLSRAEWQALRRGLAFDRAERTPSIAEFVAAFNRPPRGKKWIAALGGAALMAGAAALIVPLERESYRARQEAAVIAAAQGPAMMTALAELRAAPAGVRDRVLLDTKARTAILAFYKARMDAQIAAPNFDFAAARKEFRELRQLLPESNAVATLSENLADRANAELRHLDELKERALRQSLLIPAQGPDNLLDVLLLIRKIDPVNKALTDPEVPIQYVQAARTAQQSNRLDQAHELLAAGVQLAPNDVQLEALQEEVERDIQKRANVKRQAELEQELTGLNAVSPTFLDNVIATRDDIETLAAIAPDSPVVKRIQAALVSVAATRVRQLLSADDVAGAQALMRNIGDLLPPGSSSAERALIQQAADANQTRAFVTLDRLRQAVVANRLEKTGSTGALDFYAQLQKSGSSADVLADARDLLAYGYLRRARRARFENNLQFANSSLLAARNQQPNATLQSMLAGEQKLLDGASQPGGAAGSAADIDAASKRFAQSLRAPTLGVAEISAIAVALDQLESFGASAQEISSGIGQAENRILAEVQRAKLKGGVDGGLYPAQLVEQASLLLPASDRLAEATKEYRGSTAVADAKTRLDALLRTPAATEQWAGDVNNVVRDLHSLLPDNDPVFVDAREIPAKTFLKAAVDARGAKNQALEHELLAMARQFDADAREPKEAPIAPVRRAAPAEPAESAEPAVVDQAQTKGIDALKARLEAQAQAGDVSGAENTANSLRAVLAGSLYVAKDLPDALISAYLQRAKDQHAAGKLREALATLAAGDRAYGRNSSGGELKRLQSRYAQEAAAGEPAAGAQAEQ
jgi:tRNA A-37 threonylcarbamoyl transferase component Bud32